MDRKSLDYFKIENGYGGNQGWFSDFWMRMGGCAAVTACDSSIYFQRDHGKKLYPFDLYNLTKKDFILFSKKMKPYLRPRIQGVNRLDIYIDGYRKYLHDNGELGIRIHPFFNSENIERAMEKVKQQIDSNIPIPYLLLRHKNSIFRFYTWHWFILAGYEEGDRQFLVRAITYGHERWIDFRALWDTGYKNRDGMILFEMD